MTTLKTHIQVNQVVIKFIVPFLANFPKIPIKMG